MPRKNFINYFIEGFNQSAAKKERDEDKEVQAERWQKQFDETLRQFNETKTQQGNFHGDEMEYKYAALESHEDYQDKSLGLQRNMYDWQRKQAENKEKIRLEQQQGMGQMLDIILGTNTDHMPPPMTADSINWEQKEGPISQGFYGDIIGKFMDKKVRENQSESMAATINQGMAKNQMNQVMEGVTRLVKQSPNVINSPMLWAFINNLGEQVGNKYNTFVPSPLNIATPQQPRKNDEEE